MRNIKNVLKFELGNYFQSKAYIISTILIAVICLFIMYVPRIKSAITGDEEDTSIESEQDTDDNEADEDKDTYVYYDASGIMDKELLTQFYPDVILKECDSEEAVTTSIEEQTAQVGFVVNSITDYDYYVYNKGMFADYSTVFTAYMGMLVKQEYCRVHDLDFTQFMTLESIPVEAHENVLGKDSTSNYWYCYILVIMIFFIIVMYGTTIATSVANEKGNRSIEIMVTSTSSTSLLFGKVFAATIATLFQVGFILLALLGGYQLNRSYWGDTIGDMLNIPSEVLIAFTVFGLGGFLIYAFMYGALGALVSKVEDLNKSSGNAQMIVTIVYMVVLINLTNIDGIVIKVCSFLPVSSYSAMFARIAMGNVEVWEVVVSAILLYASVIGIGFLGGKIFRNSTLRYGNPIKISNAIKELKKKK